MVLITKLIYIYLTNNISKNFTVKIQPYYSIFLLFFSLLVFSCKSEANNKEVDRNSLTTTEQVQSIDLDTINVIDTTQTIKKVYENPEVQEAHIAIVKEFGEQWDFCKCIVKSDSINTALMEASDEEFDAVMVRSDYIDSKCKGLLIQPNATPEDRYAHEKKVKKCLDNAKQI